MMGEDVRAETCSETAPRKRFRAERKVLTHIDGMNTNNNNPTQTAAPVTDGLATHTGSSLARNARTTECSRVAVAIACITLEGFIGPTQVAALIEVCRGGEQDYFFRKLVELAKIVSNMPETYEQDGKGDDAIAYLHYFTSGTDFYITEKDAGCDADGPGDFQRQAFGRADLYGDGGELGYISILEILSAGAELDLYFKPKTLREIERYRRRTVDADMIDEAGEMTDRNSWLRKSESVRRRKEGGDNHDK
jgi:hypothetical protein